MDISIFKDWLGVLASLLAFILSIYAILTKPSKENSDKLVLLQEAITEQTADLSTRITGHGQRIQKLESEVSHLPDKDLVHRLELAISNMQGDLQSMASSIMPLNASFNRLESYIIKKGVDHAGL